MKLRVTNRLTFPARLSFVLDTGNGRLNQRGQCILTTHPEEQARLAGLIEPLYPALAAYHDVDVANAMLTDYRSAWPLAP